MPLLAFDLHHRQFRSTQAFASPGASISVPLRIAKRKLLELATALDRLHLALKLSIRQFECFRRFAPKTCVRPNFRHHTGCAVTPQQSVGLRRRGSQNTSTENACATKISSSHRRVVAPQQSVGPRRRGSQAVVGRDFKRSLRTVVGRDFKRSPRTVGRRDFK